MISRIHTYASLLTVANLILYAVVGLSALVDRQPAQPVVAEQRFTVKPGETDRAIAERVVALLRLSLATPVHDFAIHRDAAHGLVLDFYHANGRHKITVMEKTDSLHIEHTRADLGRYLSTLHVTTAAFHSGDWRMQLWAWWNEFAMWCLLVMTTTGIWIWARRRAAKGTWRRVHRYTAFAMIALLALYELSALHMAHRTWVKAGPVLTWLDRVHRMRGFSFAPVLGAGLLLLGVSGLYLWWRLQRERLAGAILLAFGVVLATGLAVWMRIG